MMSSDQHSVTEWPPWLPRLRMRPGMSPEPPAPVDTPAALDESAPPQLDPGAALRLLWERGGWDGRLSPEDAWDRLVGAHCPYPEGFAAYATYGPLDRLLLDAAVTTPASARSPVRTPRPLLAASLRTACVP